jgi:hypothetical protein
MTSAIPHTTSDVDTDVFLALFGVLAAAVIVAAAVRSLRRRDVVPIAVCAGALLCALNEPIYDELGKIVYADDATRAYTAFGRDIPLFLVVGYVPWLAGLSYVVAELMRRGASRGRLHWIALGSLASVAAIETAGTSVHAWTYYGAPPLKYLGVAPAMAPVPIVAGALIYVLGTRLSGARRLLIGLVPLFALPAVYAAACMPMYVALHSQTSKLVQYLAGVATLALCAAVTAAATAIAAWWHAGEAAGSPRSTTEAANGSRAELVHA